MNPIFIFITMNDKFLYKLISGCIFKATEPIKHNHVKYRHQKQDGY